MWQLAQAQAGWAGPVRGAAAAAAAAVAAALVEGPAAAGPAASEAASCSCSFLAIRDADRAASSTSGGGPALPLPLWEGEAARMLLAGASGRLGLPARRGRGSSEGGAKENRLKRLLALALLLGMAAAVAELPDGLWSTAAAAQAVSLTTASPSLASASGAPLPPSSLLHRGVPAKLPRLLMLDLPMEDSPHE